MSGRKGRITDLNSCVTGVGREEPDLEEYEG